jgi:hypothetical protein
VGKAVSTLIAPKTKGKRDMIKVLLGTAIAASLITCAAKISVAQQKIIYSAPQIRLPLMQTPPVIDGTIHDNEWSGADRMERFGRSAPLSPQQASFWVGGDAQNLYIAVRTETPPNGQILQRANQLPGDTDARPFDDDSIEIYLCPNPTAPAAEQLVYQGIFNARSAIYDQLFTASGGQAWRGNWQIKNSVNGDHWDCEIALPWKDVGIMGSPLGKTMALRIGRDWKRSIGSVQTEWSPLGGDYLTESTMARVTWDASAPVVQVLQLQDAPDQSANIDLQITNPTSSAVKVLSQVDLFPQGSEPTQNKETIAVAAGASQKLHVHSPALNDEPVATDIEVASPDGKTIYYKRNFSWKINRPDTIWNLDPDAAKRIDTQFAYFPSFNAMHVLVDIANLQQRKDVKSILLSIRKKGATQNIVQTTMPPLKNSSSELRRWDIPTLDAGDYELVTQLQGIDVKPEVQPFTRQHFAWEGNTLGLSDIVVPPFTPIVVQGNEIDTVLRQHQINGVGLWNQVVADGDSLLKAPMRLEAAIGGKVLSAQGNVKVLSHKATQVVTNATWQAGALHGSTQSDWDYDGVMKSTFTLEPTAQKVDSLTLVIPLDEKLMPLMHACTDGVHFNYAGTIPAGQGVVWKSNTAARNSIIGNYVPYIWVGGPERGLSVFGDNDAGWITAGKTPCQEIVRNADGTLELRLHLIQTPSSWNKPRQITIGFQATPVKPMPQNWRLWTIGANGSSKAPGKYHQGWLGSCFPWGAATAFADLYPRKQDFSIYDALEKARKTGVIDKDFIEQWLKGYILAGGEKGKAQLAQYSREVNYGFRIAAGQPDGMLVYTNSTGTRFDTPQGQTFLNEWNSNAFPQRHWNYAGFDDYTVDAVPSFRDYAAWYWKKMLTTFDDGIYWDNTFLVSNFNPITSAAFVLPDGQVQPSAALWDKRALVRRGAVLADELGKPNRNMVHMTDGAIAPILSFATSQLGWENHAGDSDFQDRFSRDYIQTVNIGRQFGNDPIVLTVNQIRTSDVQKKNWINRTAAGVMLTHEIKPLLRQYPTDLFFENYDRLVNFGYGQPGVTVYNYWDKSTFPAQVSGDTSSIIASKPGHAMMVICDWGGGGNVQVKLDTKVLSLNGALKVTNAETGEPLTVSGNTISFTLKKHDFEVIQIDAQ